VTDLVSLGHPAAAAANTTNASLVDRADLTSSIARFVVRPDDSVRAFEPGQYFALGLVVDGRLLQRPYSTSSPAGTGHEVEFLVRLVPDGAFTPRLWRLAVSDRLRIGPPKGLFTLRPNDSRTHLFISTGTGLAPFVAMTAGLRARRMPPRSIVVHGVSRVGELAYRDRLEGWARASAQVRYVPALSRPDDSANVGWTGVTGRIDAALDRICDHERIDPADTVAYLCGNPGMIASAGRVLAGRGFAEDAVISEYYWTDPGPATSPSMACLGQTHARGT
jgi:ferredoxin--NADP+ reductase